MAVLRNATISFHTNDEDKDSNTHVTVTLFDSGNTVAARVSNDFGHFHDDQDSGPFALVITNPSTKTALQSGKVVVHVDPHGHDTWRFNCFLR